MIWKKLPRFIGLRGDRHHVRQTNYAGFGPKRSLKNVAGSDVAARNIEGHSRMDSEPAATIRIKQRCENRRAIKSWKA